MFGSEVNVDARFGGNIAHKLYYSLSGRYLYKYGYRKGDESNAYNIGGNLTYDFNDRHSLSLDASYYKGIVNTSPSLLFYTGGATTNPMQPIMIDNSPSQSKRYDEGLGTIKTIQDRVDVVLTYEGKLAENHKIQVKALYHYLKNKYDTNVQSLWYSVSTGTMNMNMFVSDVTQSGSYFTDQKMGGQIRYDWNHRNGLFIAGFDSIYNIGERYLALNYPPSTNMRHYLYTPITMNKLTNSLYAIEKYDFTQRFSLTLGARYENANYTGTRKYSFVMNNPTPQYGVRRPNYTISDNISNFALELTPKYEFGSGNVYAKYERGFRSPNPDNLSSYSGSAYVDSNVRSEYYHTFEIGSKLNLGSHVFVSGAVFYTLTENELYNYGSAHSGMSGFGFGNYGLTQRAGVELFSEQAFFERSLRFSESFTYVDARILSGSRNGVNMDNRLIPYVSNYKATIGANWDISKHFGIWTQNSFVGEQRDLANRRIDAYILTDLGVDMRFGDFSVAVGVRNLFNTLYFMYYNSDTSDMTIGYSYLYAPGRTFFADLRYAF